MYEGLVNNLRKAADEWEKKHPFIAFGELRVHDALRDAARALKEADDTLERVTLERDAAVADLVEVKDCLTCKHSANCKTGSFDCYHCSDKDCPCLTCQYVWRGVKESKPNGG